MVTRGLLSVWSARRYWVTCSVDWMSAGVLTGTMEPARYCVSNGVATHASAVDTVVSTTDSACTTPTIPPHSSRRDKWTWWGHAAGAGGCVGSVPVFQTM
jgi:hypothetical protein